MMVTTGTRIMANVFPMKIKSVTTNVLNTPFASPTDNAMTRLMIVTVMMITSNGESTAFSGKTATPPAASMLRVGAFECPDYSFRKPNRQCCDTFDDCTFFRGYCERSKKCVRAP
eukprot:scaffold41684_cov160-Amphora_coffeaeformis.AAC.4